MGWLLPVGIPGGVNSGFQGVPDGSGIVRLGNEIACLETDHYRLWRAAAAALEVQQLAAWGVGHGITDARRRIRQLEDAELLIAEQPIVAPQIRGLAIHLIGECLGNGAEAAPFFIVRGRGGAILQVDGLLFELLLRTAGFDPISVTCDASLTRADQSRVIVLASKRSQRRFHYSSATKSSS